MTTLTALMLFWLGKKILDETAGIVVATSYAVLAASPTMLGLAGHATHFAAFFATAGLCFLWLARQNAKWPAAFVSGLFFGAAILMKQHAAIIAAWAGIAFAAAIFRRKEICFSKRLAVVTALGVGTILPFGLCCLILWRAGVFGNFWFWTIEYARQYVALTPISEASARFWTVLPWIASTTVLLWLLAVAGLALAWFDERLRPVRGWLLGFGLASALTVFPGFYFREHYFLMTLPAVALFAGCAISGIDYSQRLKPNRMRLQNLLLIVYAVFLAATVFINCDVWLSLTPAQAAREVYGSNPFSEAQTVAGFIRSNSVSTATVAVIGSEPEIYFLAHRHSATGYIYTYAMMEPQPFALKMQHQMISDIETNRPEFVIFADNIMSWNRRDYSDPAIFKWWDGYKTNYTLIGLTDIISPTNTIYVFGTNYVARYPEAHGSALEIFQRK
jgi:hypothetical protein